MNICNNKRSTAFFNLHWGAVRSWQDFGGSRFIREPQRYIKHCTIKTYMGYVDFKRSIQHWTWKVSMNCLVVSSSASLLSGAPLAALAKELYFQSRAKSNSRPGSNHHVEIIIVTISLQCTHSGFSFPSSERTFIWLLMMKYRRLIAENLQGHIYCTIYSKPHLVH